MKNLSTCHKVLPLLLLGCIPQSYAADTYDAASQTLTIPLVVVGSNTFSNVVVKLKDFELLKVDPNPLQGVEDQGFLMQFKSAVQQGNQLKVTVDVTSKFKDRKADVGYRIGYSYDASLTDDKGALYRPKSTQVGNISSNSSYPVVSNFPFSANLTTPVVFIFDNIATNATSIGSFDIVLYNPDDRLKSTYKVTNIPFQKASTTSPF